MLQTKALYNLFRINLRDGEPLEVDPWVLEDLRALDISLLWKKLAAEQILLDRAAFCHYAEEVDSPEELTVLLTDEALDQKTVDRVYLVLFELWRRLLPEKPSLSIFLR